MKVLLDTNIVIHREAATVVRDDIGTLFYWLDKLGATKCVHPASIAELGKHGDPKVRATFGAKLGAYHKLATEAPLSPDLAFIASSDRSPNDHIDTKLVNELHAARVDVIISEDRGLARKATLLGIADRVFTIDAFLEKAIAENPLLLDYSVPTVRKAAIGSIDVRQTFFDGFRADYGGVDFDRWFARKCDESAYVSELNGQLAAFLYLKLEDEREGYSDITPPFSRKRRLKIGTLKVEANGFKLGERLLKVVFDNAINMRVDEIYVTIFPRSVGQLRLIDLLSEFGFRRHGTKSSASGAEDVYVRNMVPHCADEDPLLSYPYLSGRNRSFLVPIYPDYHTELFPDSILKTESPDDFIEHDPHRNSIQKVYISRSHFRALKRGDVLVFYRTGGYYKGVVSTLGVVQGTHQNIANAEQFIRLCRKRSVFSDSELRKHWDYTPGNRPFITEFAYAYSFPRRPNLKELIDNGVIRDVSSAPRGFEQITPEQFATIISLTRTDQRIIVN